MAVVRCELIMPFAAAGIRIERDHRTREQVVAGAYICVKVGAGITDGPVQRVGIGIVAACEPRGTAAMLPAFAFPCLVAELAWSGNRVEAPQPFACRGIIGVDESVH